MANLLPSTPDSSVGDDGDPRVIGVDSDDADDLLAALQSDTARDLLAALYDEPATPSALAEEIDTSIQNVRYHLEKLTDAELIEVADTVYSEKGREMNVYAPAAKPLVVFAGGEDDAPGLEAALSRLLGGLGVLGLSSLLVQRLVTGGPLAPGVTFQSGDSGGGDVGSGAATDVNASADDAATTAAGADDAATTEEWADAGANGGRETTASQETTVAEEATVPKETTAADTTEGDVSIFGESTGETTAEAAETTAESAGTTADAAETVEAATRTVTESAETTRVVEETTVATDQPQATEAMETTEQALTTTVTEAADAATGGLEPGLLFFAGGLVVLAAVGVAWYLRAR
ncbi:ArsR/SmtB family transcription factor [Halorussus litoreus]|uniref:ArsR/SmtB family transcription factor n=1 Tax=Halorussus litoreus TaxID=1710536 RepID=UPI000E287198|nr:helix-turn-helix domain-containing protein [Halorussus litoreus]